MDNCSDTESAWCTFIEQLNAAVDDFVPRKPRRNNTNQHRKHYPKYIIKLMQKKRKLWRKYRRSKSPKNKEAYISVAKKCRTEIYKHDVKIETEIISSRNLGLFYKHINKSLSTRSGVGALKDSCGSLLTDDHKKAELLNDFFCSVGTIDNGQIPEFHHRLSEQDSEVDQINFTPQLVFDQLRKLKNSLAAGPDKLTPIFLKKIASEICLPLAKIFTMSFESGSLPSIWKCATVTPVFKGGISSDTNNYRPISLTCICCKIMESIMKDEVLKHLSKNKLISTQQHGFLSKRSTVTNLLDSLNDWTITIKDSHSVDVAYIDYRKAFDSVCHSKLLAKLRGYGFGTNLINWIFAYLTDRTQTTCINGHLSSSGRVVSGVPQGSVLGPILFLLYINDVIDIFDHEVEARLFADDLKLYSSITSDSDSIRLQINLQQLEQWSDLWQLTISVKKCSILHISNNDKPKSKYTLCNTVLPNSSPVRDLGVLVDSKLKFGIHINSVVSCHKSIPTIELHLSLLFVS